MAHAALSIDVRMSSVIYNGFCVREPARYRGASRYSFLDPVAYSCLVLYEST